jgi:hypothetical protein
VDCNFFKYWVDAEQLEVEDFSAYLGISEVCYRRCKRQVQITVFRKSMHQIARNSLSTLQAVLGYMVDDVPVEILYAAMFYCRGQALQTLGYKGVIKIGAARSFWFQPH